MNKKTITIQNNKVYIYFINVGHGHTKIGVSCDPQNRLKQCQTGNPYELKIEKLEEYSSYEEAFKREKELHNKFKDYKLYGEWFKATLVELFSKYYSPTYNDYIDVVLSHHSRNLLI